MPINQGPQIADFWVGLASIPILGTLITLIFKNRAALSQDILHLQKAIAALELSTAEKHATKEYVNSVEARVMAMHDKLDAKLDKIDEKIGDKLDKIIDKINQ